MTTNFYAENLTVGYDENIIIRNMDIKIPYGEITVILGSNGCGKSTLLKTMARLLKPAEGAFKLEGVDIANWQSKTLARHLGLLPQSPTVPDGIKVRDLVARGRYPYQKMFSSLTQEDYDAIAWAMKEMNIEALADRSVDELSGGQRQRVWIALSLAQRTDILLLDEPTTYLDIVHQVEILDSVKRLNKSRETTVVTILHDINFSIRYADNIIAMKKGSIVAQGKPTDIITPELMKEVYDLDCIIIEDPETGLPYVIPKVNQLHKLSQTE